MAVLKFFFIASVMVASAFSEEKVREKKDLLLGSAYVAPAYAPAYAAPAYAAPVIPAAPALAAPVIPAAPAVAAPVFPAAPAIAAPVVPAAPVIPAVHTFPAAYSTSYRIDRPRYLHPGINSYLY